MAETAILIVRSDNGTVPRTGVHEGRSAMFEKLTEELLDLRVTERGTPAVGNAFAAIPISSAIEVSAFLMISNVRGSSMASSPGMARGEGRFEGLNAILIGSG